MDRRVAGQWDACVLLVSGQEHAEIIERTPEKVLTLLHPQRGEKRGLEEEFRGWVPTLVTKIIKGDGTWMYYAPSTNPLNRTGTKWFTRDGIYD